MSKKKKIAILQNGLYWGGTDTFVINLCKGLDKEKFDITVINPSTAEGQREKEITDAGVEVIHTYPTIGIKGRLKHLWRLYKILRKERFEVFHTNIDLFNGPNLFVAWLAQVPLRICHSHNAQQSKELKDGRTFSVKAYQRIMRWMCWNFSNRRIGCSELANDFLYRGRDWISSELPTIINNGIDLLRFKKQINKEEFKKENGFKAPFNIITIGHLIEQKNPLFIANLFNEICKIRNDVNLIWVGEGILKNQVLEILKENNSIKRVHFLSKRKDIKELLKISDVFILPSNFEGLPIVSIEAQATGIPAILSSNITELANCGGILYLPITQGFKEWINTINDILNAKLELKADPSKLNQFSIEYMIYQMSKIFES